VQFIRAYKAIAVQVIDTDGHGGLIMSIGDGVVTNRFLWKCTTQYYNDWEAPDFDDTNWPDAKEAGPQGADPWGWRPRVASNAKWIWTKNTQKDNQVYCRYSRPVGEREMNQYRERPPGSVQTDGAWGHSTQSGETHDPTPETPASNPATAPPAHAAPDSGVAGHGPNADVDAESSTHAQAKPMTRAEAAAAAKREDDVPDEWEAGGSAEVRAAVRGVLNIVLFVATGSMIAVLWQTISKRQSSAYSRVPGDMSGDFANGRGGVPRRSSINHPPGPPVETVSL